MTGDASRKVLAGLEVRQYGDTPVSYPHFYRSPDGSLATLVVPEIGIPLAFAISPDARFVLGWGHQKYAYKIALLEHGNLAWSRAIPPCWSGKVANDGTCAILHELGQQGLRRMVLVLGVGGRPKLECSFATPISMLILSDDGVLLCFCARIRDARHSQCLHVYSLADDPALLLVVPLPVKAINAIEISGNEVLVTADGTECRFGYSLPESRRP